MKKTLIAFTILLTSFQLFGQEDDRSEKVLQDVITTSPFILGTGELYFAYERAINFRSAFVVRGVYTNQGISAALTSNTFTDNRPDFDVFSVGVGYKFYLFKKENRQQGLYLLGGANYVYGSYGRTINNEGEPTTPYRETISRANLEVAVGYQLVLNKFLKGLTFDASVGQEYAIPLGSERNGQGRRRTQTAIRAGIGYSF